MKPSLNHLLTLIAIFFLPYGTLTAVASQLPHSNNRTCNKVLNLESKGSSSIWTPDIQTNNGRLRLLKALGQRFSGFNFEENPHRSRPLLTSWEAVAELKKELDSRGLRDELQPIDLQSTTYAAGIYVVNTKKNEVSERIISIEKIPPLVAVGRGNFLSLKASPSDFSLSTAGLYSMIRGVEVFAIRNTNYFQEDPIGYILSVEVTHEDGLPLPYILTVNIRQTGNSDPKLQTAETEAAIGLYLAVRNSANENSLPSHRLAFMKWEEYGRLGMLSESIKQAMTLPNGIETNVKLPLGWLAVDRI